MKINFTISNIGDGQVILPHKFQSSNQQNMYKAVQTIQICSNMYVKQSIKKESTDKKKSYKKYKHRNNGKEERMNKFLIRNTKNNKRIIMSKRVWKCIWIIKN